MIINKQEAKRAGKLTNQVYGWTDEELKIMIKFEELFIAFLEGKGLKWSLARTPLYLEVNQFKSFLETRKRED